MDNLRLDTIGLRGSRDGGFEAVDPFPGDKGSIETRPTDSKPAQRQRGRDGEASHRFVASASFGCGSWPIWVQFYTSSVRSYVQNGQNSKNGGGFSIWGSTPQGAFDPMGNRVTASWVHGDLASCQSPSCDGRHAQNPWFAMCYPKWLVSFKMRLPKMERIYCPLWILAVCDTAPSGRAPFWRRSARLLRKRHPSFELSPFVRISDKPKSLLPTFWASEEYQKWRQGRAARHLLHHPLAQGLLCLRYLSA
jgi:hypothetical protein